MRRSDRQITDFGDIVDVLRRCRVCRLAFIDNDGYPYIVPLNFGFLASGGRLTFYFHSAHVGKKIDLIRHDRKAAFEFDLVGQLVAGDAACDYTMTYESVCGTGDVTVVTDDGEKARGLGLIMQQYAPDRSFTFDDAALRSVAVLKLAVREITGKRLMV